MSPFTPGPISSHLSDLMHVPSTCDAPLDVSASIKYRHQVQSPVNYLGSAQLQHILIRGRSGGTVLSLVKLLNVISSLYLKLASRL